MEFSVDTNHIYIQEANVTVVNQGGGPSITSTSPELDQYITMDKAGNAIYIKINSSYSDNLSNFPLKVNVAGLSVCSVEIQKGKLDAGAICPTVTNYVLHQGIAIADIPTAYYHQLNVSANSGTIEVREYIRASNGALLKKYPDLYQFGKHDPTIISGQQAEGGNVWSMHVDTGSIIVRGEK